MKYKKSTEFKLTMQANAKLSRTYQRRKAKGGDAATLINAKTNTLRSAALGGFKHCGCEPAEPSCRTGSCGWWETAPPGSGRNSAGSSIPRARSCRLQEGAPKAAGCAKRFADRQCFHGALRRMQLFHTLSVSLLVPGTFMNAEQMAKRHGRSFSY